jgi:predicted Rossmann fold flavoprotein
MPDVCVRVLDGAASLATRRGSMLFTHFGLSGPVVLDVSRVVSRHSCPCNLRLAIDFLPQIRETDLDEKLRTSSSSAGKRLLASVLCEVVPRRLGEELLKCAGLPVDRTAAALPRLERGRLVTAIKNTQLLISGTLGFKKAEVTAGGIALDEVDSRTMSSKLVPGLYVAGEILDLDGPIGGFNFQAAWSTGWLAGQSA